MFLKVSSKNLSPIGYLMKLLDISIPQLVQYLHIDRTTISKWKTGSRNLTERSPYYNKLIDYFILKNSAHSDKPLYSFFSSMYTDLDYTKDDFLHCCISRYLQSNRTLGDTKYFVEDNKRTLYQTNVSVFRGLDGRKNAVNMLLNIAENSNELCEINILELNEIEWLGRDTAFIQNFVNRLEKLASLGHKIEIAYSSLKDIPEFRVFMTSITPLIFNKNVNCRIIRPEFALDIIPSIYAIKNKFVAVGINLEETLSNMYTNVFLDSFTVEKCILAYKKIIKIYAEPMIKTENNFANENLLRLMKYTATKKEPIYFIGKHLTIATMKEDLIAEILKQNNLSSTEIKRCTSFYNTLRNTITINSNRESPILYLNIDKVQYVAKSDHIIEYELSALTNKQIYITKKQYLRHLSDTADVILNNNVKVVLVGNKDIGNNVSCAWIKRNLWCLLINTPSIPNENKMMFVDDINLVKVFEDISLKIISNYVLKLRDKNYIINIFKKLSNNEEI